MPTFATLIEYEADAEAEALEQIRERFEDASGLVEAHGGEVKATYFGSIAGYDAMTVTEFPDREAFEKANVMYSMNPAIKAETAEVHSYEEYATLVEETMREHAGRVGPRSRTVSSGCGRGTSSEEGATVTGYSSSSSDGVSR